jgi:DNA-binding NarL/FixJ family response regulator
MSITILIIKDHDTLRSILQRRLEAAFPRCRVIEAASGEEAVALLGVESPRLVVTDIGLPGMNGIETTRQIKARSPSTQVVMLTMYEDDAYRVAAIAAGAGAYVPKRLVHTDLLPALSTFLA